MTLPILVARNLKCRHCTLNFRVKRKRKDTENRAVNSVCQVTLALADDTDSILGWDGAWTDNMRPTLFRPLTLFGHCRNHPLLWLSLGHKAGPGVKLMSLRESRVRHGARVTLERRERSRGSRSWHQAVATTRPRVKPAFSTDTGVQLPEGSCIRSSGHFQSNALWSGSEPIKHKFRHGYVYLNNVDLWYVIRSAFAWCFNQNGDRRKLQSGPGWHVLIKRFAIGQQDVYILESHWCTYL